jgi:hypothetical protein
MKDFMHDPLHLDNMQLEELSQRVFCSQSIGGNNSTTNTW